MKTVVGVELRVRHLTQRGGEQAGVGSERLIGPFPVAPFHVSGVGTGVARDFHYHILSGIGLRGVDANEIGARVHSFPAG